VSSRPTIAASPAHEADPNPKPIPSPEREAKAEATRGESSRRANGLKSPCVGPEKESPSYDAQGYSGPVPSEKSASGCVAPAVNPSPTALYRAHCNPSSLTPRRYIGVSVKAGRFQAISTPFQPYFNAISTPFQRHFERHFNADESHFNAISTLMNAMLTIPGVLHVRYGDVRDERGRLGEAALCGCV
jgi:hypothetical protein